MAFKSIRRFSNLKLKTSNPKLNILAVTCQMPGSGGPKALGQFYRAILENFFDVRSYQPAMDEEIKRHGVTDMVPRQGAAVLRLKGVFVNPLPVRTVELFVHKTIRRLPDIDAGAPAYRDAAYSEFIINQRAFAHAHGHRRKDLKI